MAIFQKAYRGYSGELSPLYFRAWVIFRYALADMFSSRIFIAFLVTSFVPTAIVLCVVYIRYNLDALMQLNVNVNDLVYIDAEFFAAWLVAPQLLLVFVLIMFVGPILVSPDLRNNAMSLYLSRPISKASYIAGKFLVLLVVCSIISWIPTVLLLFYQGYLAGNSWLVGNINLPFAVIGIFLLWITSLGLLSLAISASVKWAPIARLAFFGVIFVGSAFGNVINAIIGGWIGSFFNLFEAAQLLTRNWFGIEVVGAMPPSAAAATLLAVAIVSLLVLLRRIRALEVA